MAKYAYTDRERINVIYSKNALTQDRNKAFFCPNPQCGAQLYVCAVDGSRSAYFSATKAKYPHVPGCPFGSKDVAFEENKFDQTQFVFDQAMDNLYSVTAESKSSKTPSGYSKGEVKKHPPRTLKQIYSMCKSYPIDDIYGNKEISEMILDDRSAYRYPKGCFGYRIIEAVTKGKLYDDKQKQIYLAAPKSSTKYSFILSFLDNKTYILLRNEIYNNRDKIIVVAGKWEKTEKYNVFLSEIRGRKQVVVIKR